MVSFLVHKPYSIKARGTGREHALTQTQRENVWPSEGKDNISVLN